MTTRADGGSALPDAFDRALENMKGRPDTLGTKPATFRSVPTLAIGGSQTYIIQTYRAQEEGGRSKDTVFVECYGADGQHRLALPAQVADAIARQREALTAKARSKAGKRQAADRAASGAPLPFQRKG